MAWQTILIFRGDEFIGQDPGAITEGVTFYSEFERAAREAKTFVHYVVVTVSAYELYMQPQRYTEIVTDHSWSTTRQGWVGARDRPGLSSQRLSRRRFASGSSSVAFRPGRRQPLRSRRFWRRYEMQITVKTEELADIPALERKHKAKLLRANILGEEAIAEMLPVASLEFFVDVWNCQGTLVLVDGEQETWVTEDEWQYDQGLYGELVERVIYDDNDGAINWSGRYWPQGEESLALFRQLIETAAPKSEGIVGG